MTGDEADGQSHRWEPASSERPALDYSCANDCGATLRRIGPLGKGGHWQVRKPGKAWERVTAPGAKGRRGPCGGRGGGA